MKPVVVRATGLIHHLFCFFAALMVALTIIVIFVSVYEKSVVWLITLPPAFLNDYIFIYFAWFYTRERVILDGDAITFISMRLVEGERGRWTRRLFLNKMVVRDVIVSETFNLKELAVYGYAADMPMSEEIHGAWNFRRMDMPFILRDGTVMVLHSLRFTDRNLRKVVEHIIDRRGIYPSGSLIELTDRL